MLGSNQRATSAVYTVGHSNHPRAKFLALLTAQGVDVLVDTRSRPASRWAPYATPSRLPPLLDPAGITYLYLGDALGGRPADPTCYDPATGRPDYAIMSRKPGFLAGIAQILDMAGGARICLLCSEEDPTQCHRSLLIGAALRRSGVAVRHIRGSGAVEEQTESSKVSDAAMPRQLPLPLHL